MSSSSTIDDMALLKECNYVERVRGYKHGTPKGVQLR